MAKKSVSFADPDFKNKLRGWMQEINPKPQGNELKALLKKYEDERAAYIEQHRKGAGEFEQA